MEMNSVLSLIAPHKSTEASKQMQNATECDSANEKRKVVARDWVSFDFSKAKLCWVLGAGRMFARRVFNMQPNICWCGGGSCAGLHVLGGVGGGIELSLRNARGGRSVIENLINVIARVR
ncbi:hypothetical protein CEXT_777311 [Caerostris extrusa]|uniref:Uncharacterized protein n=1 Tax=Caerostris extrusa TaxID=172846 RepID=A0AAV4Q942_CAEEX|nr:hypothetical protein CEXT_777311 [Caerostris extrusa]